MQLRFRSIPEMIRERAEAYPDSVAYITASRTWTYAQLDQASNRIAQGLAAQGVGSGDVVACLTKHAAECVVMLLAAGKVGATLSPMNWRLASRELEYVMAVARPKVLLADAFLTDTLREVGKPCVNLQLVTEDDGSEFAFGRWLERFPAIDPGQRPQLDDSAVQLFSSGTTGLPKSVDLSHRGIFTQCEAWTPLFGYEEGRDGASECVADISCFRNRQRALDALLARPGGILSALRAARMAERGGAPRCGRTRLSCRPCCAR